MPKLNMNAENEQDPIYKQLIIQIKSKMDERTAIGLENNKITMIKDLRNMVNIDIKSAKTFIENYFIFTKTLIITFNENFENEMKQAIIRTDFFSIIEEN